MRKINKEVCLGWYAFGHKCYEDNVLIHEVNFPDMGAKIQFEQGYLDAHLIARYSA